MSSISRTMVIDRPQRCGRSRTGHLRAPTETLWLVETDDDKADTLYVRWFPVRASSRNAETQPRLAAVLPTRWSKRSAKDIELSQRQCLSWRAALAYAQIGEADTALSLLAECLGTPAAVLCNQELVPCAVRAALSGETSSWLPISSPASRPVRRAPHCRCTSTSLPPCGRWSRRLAATT